MKTLSETTVKADFFFSFFLPFCFPAMFFSYHDLLMSDLITGEVVDMIGVNEANNSWERKKTSHRSVLYSKAVKNLLR